MNDSITQASRVKATAAAEINVGERTVISYLLGPVVRLFDGSLREP